MLFCSFVSPQRHLLRDRRRSTAARPATWAMGTQEVEMCTLRKNYFVLGQLEHSRQDKNLLYQHHELNEPTKEGPLSYVLLDSPFASASTVSRGHPTLVSLVAPITIFPITFSSGRWQDLPLFADKHSKATT
jgi:hypothetical protein